MEHRAESNNSDTKCGLIYPVIMLAFILNEDADSCLNQIMHNTNDEFIKSSLNIPPEFVCDNVKLEHKTRDCKHHKISCSLCGYIYNSIHIKY